MCGAPRDRANVIIDVSSRYFRPYHPPFDWGSVYADQLYTNAACYMRLRHSAKWIATVDIDEMIEITRPDGIGIPHEMLADGSTAVAPTPWRLPDFLDSVPDHVTEIALMHCRLMYALNV